MKRFRMKLALAGAKKKKTTKDWRMKRIAKQKAQAMQKKNNKKPQAKQLTKCPICCVEYTPKTIKDHYSTDLHKELAAMKEYWRCETKLLKTLNEQIQQRGADIPLVGLQHIRQYHPNEKEEHVYECVLCRDTFRPRTIFYHVMSVPHRINYLAKYHESMGIDKTYQVKTREQYLHLVTCAANAAQVDGRQPIKIMDHLYLPKAEYARKTASDWKKRGKNYATPVDSESSRPPTGIGMGVRNQALASVVPTRPRAFQSGLSASDGGSSKNQENFMKLLSFLKSDQEAAMAGPAAGSGMPSATTQPVLPKLNPLLRNPIAFIKGGQASEPKMIETGKSEDLKSESVAVEIPRLCIPDCFWCNEELYGFLGHVTMEKQEEVDFALKVREMLSSALARHKQRTYSIRKRIEEEKKKLEIEIKELMNKPGVNKALQKIEEANPRSGFGSGAAAGKRKASTDVSSGNKPSFPIGSAPVSTEPPSKAKRLVSLSLESDRSPATQSYSNASQQRVPGSQFSQPGPSSLTRPGMVYNTGPSAANTNPSQQRMAGSQFGQSGPSSGSRPAFGQASNRPQGPQSNANPSQQWMPASQFSQSGLSSLQRSGTVYTGPSTANTNHSLQRMPGSQYGQFGPSSASGPSFGQTSNKPQDPQGGQRTAAMGPTYGAAQGNWSLQPGAGAGEQA